MNLSQMHWTTLIVFFVFVIGVAGQGFISAYRKAGPANSLADWSLGGRQFGILFTLVLVGGDFYTAYTVIAVPAAVYAVGAYGFFALPFTIIVYPFFYTVMPRLWTVCKQQDYMTAADFVQGRYQSRGLALAVAMTSLLAMVPYIALQMVGIEVVIENLGLGHGNLSLFIAFLILAVYTYHSGLKAPAMLSFGKAIMIFIVIIAAVIWIPHKLGGFPAIFSSATSYFAAKGGATGTLLQSWQMLPYASLALGSALAGFMYPHALTGVLSSSGTSTIKWNAILLPGFTILLGLIALLGYMAIAAGIHVADSKSIVPVLLLQMFPEWFVGFSFAAIVIGALVPAAIMAIGTATLFTRNILKAHFLPGLTPGSESRWAKRVSVIILFVSLCFVVFLPTQYAIDLQLIGGVWILQIFPAVVFGLYRSGAHSSAYLAGWLAGMVAGTGLILANGLKPVFALHLFNGSYSLFIGLIALALNIAISLGASRLLALLGRSAAGCQILETLD
jgi:SSS family solute:Na+ symporter